MSQLVNDSWLNGTNQSVPFTLNVSSTYAFTQQCLNFFNFYYLAIIIVVGVVGNSLSFLVFTRTHLKLRSSSYYLAALALADLGFLLTLLVVWLNHVGIDLFNRYGWCQALVYGSSVCSCLSVWLTVAFTVERLIAVQYPLQRPSMCTVRRAKTIIFVLTFVTLSAHIYSLFTAGITHGSVGGSEDRVICELLPEYYQFMRIVNLLDTILTLVIPFILIVSMNAMIAKNLFVFSRTFKKPNYRSSSQSHIQMKSLRLSEGWEHDSGKGSASIPSAGHSQNSHSSHVNGSHSTNGNAMRMTTSLTTNGAATTTTVTDKNQAASVVPAAKESSVANGSVNHSPANQNGSVCQLTRHDLNDTHHDKLHYRNILSIRIQYSITKMLLLISTVFILLNLPSYVIRLHVFISDVVTHSTHEPSPTAWLLQQFFMLLYYTNFSINFLLYSTCGATFRHCLCRLIRDKVDAFRRFFRLNSLGRYQNR